MSIFDWGWNSAWTERFSPHRLAGLAPARVVDGSRGVYELETDSGRVRGELAGRLEYAAGSPLELPVAGDWVAITPTDPALMVHVVERQSLFTRVQDGGQRQALAANVNVAFLVCGLDRDWNPARLDRYLALAMEAGVQPVIVLNKRDLCSDPAAIYAIAAALAPTVLLSGTLDDPAPLLGSFVEPGQTAALFGSSGVGKSTIVNALLREEAQAIGETVCQHTTTSRTLIRLPQGWLLLDMPGLRAVGVGGGVADAFADVAELAAQCRFSDCSHDGEPGCAVENAVAPERLASFRKLQKEAAYQHRREDGNAARAEKERWKQIHAAMKKMPKKGR